MATLDPHIGSRHTEFGGGPSYPQRLPDDSKQPAAVLDADEKARAVRAAAWDEVRGDPGTGAGVVERYAAVGKPVPTRDRPLNTTETANGYMYDAATGTFTVTVS